MKGMELARRYYEEYGAPMIARDFAQECGKIACGLVGEGSECFGFDDELSRDHDFGAGFCIWLADEDAKDFGSELDEAYRRLPGEFMGYPQKETAVAGSKRTGVMRIHDFYQRFTGRRALPETIDDWRRIPEAFLATATNGCVFSDGAGVFSAMRTGYLAYYPEDLRLKKICARAAAMAQAGQYNYPRMLRRGDKAAALLALSEYVKAACSMAYLLNRKYMPFYKWAARGLLNMDKLPELHGMLGALCGEETPPGQRTEHIEQIAAYVIEELATQSMTDHEDGFLLTHCGCISQRIGDEQLRQMHHMAE
ncbi:MAG TPA: hypothetical protein DEB31_10055 [Clostridiales bacterium]|nr:hypothetical protein [Clostridiales bacterium]